MDDAKRKAIDAINRQAELFLGEEEAAEHIAHHEAFIREWFGEHAVDHVAERTALEKLARIEGERREVEHMELLVSVKPDPNKPLN